MKKKSIQKNNKVTEEEDKSGRLAIPEHNCGKKRQNQIRINKWNKGNMVHSAILVKPFWTPSEVDCFLWIVLVWNFVPFILKQCFQKLQWLRLVMFSYLYTNSTAFCPQSHKLLCQVVTTRAWSTNIIQTQAQSYEYCWVKERTFKTCVMIVLRWIYVYFTLYLTIEAFVQTLPQQYNNNDTS